MASEAADDDDIFLALPKEPLVFGDDNAGATGDNDASHVGGS